MSPILNGEIDVSIYVYRVKPGDYPEAGKYVCYRQGHERIYDTFAALLDALDDNTTPWTGDPAHSSDNLYIELSTEPKSQPYQEHYDGGQWQPCLRIEGPNMGGYYRGSRLILDAPRALELLAFLKQHKSTLEQLAK